MSNPKKKCVKIFIFCDAVGYELVKRHKFLAGDLPWQYPLGMQFGYSCTAVPTYLCGKKPEEHGHFSFFFYDRSGESPFKIFRFLKYFLFPRCFFDHHRVRNKISVLIKKMYGFTGYFNIYRMPFEKISYFDYCEKNNIFVANGLQPCENIEDVLRRLGVKHLVSDWHNSDEFNLEEARRHAAEGDLEFMLIYTAKTDGMLHFHVNEPDYIQKTFDALATRIRAIIEAAKSSYENVDFYLFSDHGMTPLAGEVDVITRIEALPYKFGQDYVAVYDSTMLRVWILNAACRTEIVNSIAHDCHGRWLADDELQQWGCRFADNKYGDLFFLMDAGWQINPSDMSGKTIPGMHGYSPLDKESMASFLSLKQLDNPPQHLRNVFDLMVAEAEKVVELRNEQ